MNRNDVEEIAVEKLKYELTKTKILKGYFNTNDRTPYWDGQIFVYKNEKKESSSDPDNFLGEFNAQIKGKSVNKITKKQKTFSMKVKTLKAYENNKVGTLLFVCEIVNIDTYQLYYANLLPVDIKDILGKVKGNKSISFKIIPIDQDENSVKSLKNVCVNFLRESRKQTNIVIKHVEQEEIKEINFQVNVPKSNKKLYDIVNSDIYFYGVTKDGERFALPKADTYYAGQDMLGDILIDGIKYYDRYKYICSSDNEELVKFGQSLTLNLKTSKATFIPKGNIDSRINDLKFFINFYNRGSFYFNSEEYVFKYKKNKKIDYYAKMLKKLEEVKEALDYFDVIIGEDLDDLDEQTIININKITGSYRGIIPKDIKDNQIYYMDISQTRILLYSISDKETNIRKIRNFFKEEDMLFFVDKTPISKYLILDRMNVDFVGKCKIDFSKIKDSLSQYYSSELNEDYNHFELSLIKAYDNYRLEQIIEMALFVNDLLQKNKTSNIDVIEELNRMQIIKRKRPLSYEEQEKINALSLDETNPNYNNFLCAKDILLNREFDLKLHLSKMSNEEQNVFKTMPIFNLVNKNDLPIK